MIYLPMASFAEAHDRAFQEASARAAQRLARDARAQLAGRESPKAPREAAAGPLLVETNGTESCLVLHDEDWRCLTVEEMQRATRTMPPWLEVKRLLLGRVG